MSYFLDLDRTIFDTESFVLYVQKHRLSMESYARSEFGLIWNNHVVAGTLRFAPGELERFLYLDAKDFIRQHARRCVIVTQSNPALQKAKIESALTNFEIPYLISPIPEQRGRFLRGHLQAYKPPHLYVDDSSTNLASVASSVGDMPLYEIRRDGSKGSGLYPTITDLAQLPEIR